MKGIVIFIVYCSLLTNLIAQTHIIEVHSNNRVASLLMSSTEYSDWKTNNEFSNDYIKRTNLFKDIYKKFNDEFDFIFLILNEDNKPDGLPHGQHIRISNNISGIGLSSFNNGNNYGSAGKLKSILHLTKRNYLLWGPSLHELSHKWANNAIEVENVAEGTNVVSSSYRPHWGFTGGSTKGQLGGFKQSTLVDKGGGSYSVGSFGANANGGNSVPFNELELYLMGMIKISDVSNFDVFTNITSFTRNGAIYDFVATTRTTYTPASLETLLGARVPLYTTSQKDFKALVVILTDTPLTTAQWDEVDDSAEKFSRNSSDGSSTLFNFWEATQGLGTIEMANLQNTLGLDNDLVLANNIKIYPNPTSKKVTILNKDLNIEEVLLFNSVGQKITSLEFTDAQDGISLDLSNHSAGVYFLNFRNNSGLSMYKKIIKN